MPPTAEPTNTGGPWRSLVPVNALVLVAVLIGFANNVLIAAVFGLTYRVDAFFAAMMLPTLFMILCIDYLGKNFLPVFAIAKREGEESASHMTSSIVTIVMLLALGVTGVLAIASAPLFELLLPGFEASEAVRVRRYFWIMAPAIVLMAVNSFHEYVCQYDGKFVQVAMIRMLLPIANMIAIVALGPLVGEYSLPWGYLAGHMAVFACTARLARYRFEPRMQIRAHLEKRVFANSAIVMSTGLLARTKSIVMNYLASSLGGGAISALAFATKLTEPLERCAFSGARMVLFSRTARLLVDDDRREVGRLYGIGLRVSFLLLAPLLWWVGLHSTEIVRIMFARGEFTPEMTRLVAGTLLGLIPSVVFIGVNRLMSNAFYAMDRVKIPAVIMPAGMIVYVACAVPLSGALGTQGLALATTLTTIVVFSALFTFLSRELVNLRPLHTLVQLVAYAALAGTVVLGIDELLDGLGLAEPVVAVVSLPLGALVYGGVLIAIRDATSLKLLHFLREWTSGQQVPA